MLSRLIASSDSGFVPRSAPAVSRQKVARSSGIIGLLWGPRARFLQHLAEVLVERDAERRRLRGEVGLYFGRQIDLYGHKLLRLLT